METEDYNKATIRHMELIDRSQQEILRSKHVAVAGMGGIGGIAALLCAKAGFGEITVCDFDRFEVVNIVEQEFANYETVGMSKVEVAAKELKKHGHECKVNTFDCKISGVEDAIEMIDGANYVFSGLDNGKAKILVDRAANQLKLPVFLAANVGWTIMHLAYMPGKIRYESMYEGILGLEKLTPEAVRFIELHHHVFLAFIGNFSESYFRGLIDGAEDHFRYMAPHAYAAASFGVNDMIKYATNRGPITVAPECFIYDTLYNKFLRLKELSQYIFEITRTAFDGNINGACALYRKYSPKKYK
jgi:molybdopterin/thiamine biosynthesis adenylyltransferase